MQPTREFKPSENKVFASVITDPGCVRETNEDTGLHVSPAGAENGNGRGSLTIVADGMGGHSSGEVASQMAVELISRYYYDDKVNAADEALRQAIETANAEIFETSADNEQYAGMGTTVVALAIQNGVGIAAHVGDSRLYRMRGGKMERMTIDHSQVMEMVQMGIISLAEAENHEDKNVILRAVGTQPSVEVEISGAFPLEPGDEFMLCSDGLSDMADDDKIRDIWAAAPDIHAAGERLIDFAKEQGGHDNVTVGVVRFAPEEELQGARQVPATREIGVA